MANVNLESDALNHACAGDRRAFDALVKPHVPMLKSVIRRLVAHPEDTEDLIQETLLTSFQKLSSFKSESKLSTWMCTIGTRKALDYLRARKRWRLEAQDLSRHEAYVSEENQAAFGRVTRGADYSFDAHEHIAYCFTCVSRTLEPNQHAAVILRDVAGFSNQEAADAVGISESMLRHALSQGRTELQRKFEGLCALVNKEGACWQCEGLRSRHPEEKRGPDIPLSREEDAPREDSYKRRLQVVQDADVHDGRAQAFHDLVWRRMSKTEEQRGFAEVAKDRAVRLPEN